MKIYFSIVASLICLLAIPALGEQKGKAKHDKKSSGRQSRQLNNNNADQMVQNILQWLQDVYGNQGRRSRSFMFSQELEPPFNFASARIDRNAFRQGSLREYLPPKPGEKPRPFTPRLPTGGSGIDEDGNFVDTGYPPAGITPQPPFNIYTNPATGGITGIGTSGVLGEDQSGPGSSYYPTQTTRRPFYTPTTYTGRPGYSTQPTEQTERPRYPGYETPGPEGPEGTPSQTIGTPAVTPGYPSGETQGYQTSSPSGFTGYPSGRPTEPSSYAPSGETGYPSFPTSSPSGFTGYPSGRPTGATGIPTGYTSRPIPGETEASPEGEIPTSPSPGTGYPTSRPTGYPTGSPTGYPTGRPSTEESEYSYRPTGYPTARPAYSPGPTGYPTGPPTGYPRGSPTEATPGPTSYPTGSPGFTTGPASYPGGPTTGSQGFTTGPTGYPTGTPGYSPSPTGFPSTGTTGYAIGSPSPIPGFSTAAPLGEEVSVPAEGIPDATEAPSEEFPGFPTGKPSESSAGETTVSVTSGPTAAPTVIPGETPQQTLPPESEGKAGILPEDDDLKHPPHIHALDVQCAKDMMTINIEFNREFNGIIYSKGYYNMPECRYVNENSGQKKYTFTVNLNMCGTEFVNAFDTEGQSYLENILVLQNEDGIQEVWDTVRSVRCLWEGNLKEQLSVTLMVGMLSQEIITFSGDTAMAKLDVLLGRGPFGQPASGLVKIGEPMTLVVSVSGDPGFDVQVKDCRATDSSGTNVVPLTDENGCIIKHKLFGAFQKTRNTGDTGASIIAYAYFNAFKFPDVMDIMIECNIELCKTDCEMCSDPDQKLEPSKRRRRDLYALNETLHDGLKMTKHLRVILPEDLASAAELLHDGVCMSTQNFVFTSSVLISLLTASTFLSVYLWISTRKLRSKQ